MTVALLYPLNENPFRITIATLGLLALSIGIWFYYYTIKPETPVIKGVPELPGAVMIHGNLNQLGKDHPWNLQKLSLAYNFPVFQALFGTQRMIVVNSFAAATEWFIKNQTALIDRPVFYTFHKLVSTTQGLTIGTSPWNETCRKRRLNVQRYMTTPAIQERAGLIDVETFSLLRDLYKDTKDGQSKYPYKYTQRLALNFTTMLSYATRFNSMETPLLNEILDLVKIISSFRSTNNNLQDFIPILRLMPDNQRKKLALQSSETRNVWLDKLTKEAIAHKDTRKSIVGDYANSDGQGRLDLDDIKCICVGLVSGGFETIGSTGALIFCQLASPKGKLWQQRIYNECLKQYGSIEAAWEKVLLEESCEFSISFIRELLRMYAVIPLIPARKTMKKFEWQGTVISEGVTVILNAQAANHDKAQFGETADQFIPERFMGQSAINNPPYHFTFSAGSRACTAINLSVRVLYAILTRTCILFHVENDPSRLPVTDYIEYAEDRTAQTYWPKDFGVTLTPRDQSTMEKCFKVSEIASKETLSYSIENN